MDEFSGASSKGNETVVPAIAKVTKVRLLTTVAYTRLRKERES